MKISEFRALIKEEVRKALKESSLNGTYKDYISTLDKFLKAKKLKGKVLYF